ncbi:MAG: exopolysaccharide biosynthesis polyprenyl glycosylphosphotransferase [Minisyncoccia bacterium]
MNSINKKEPLLLFLGDLLLLVLSLWLAILLRTFSWPDWGVFVDLLEPFSILIVVWLGVFFIAGLYEKHTTVFTGRLSNLLLNSLVANGFIAVTFFYLFPIFGVNPKTILFIYLILSFSLIYLWRYFGHRLFCIRTKAKALIIGSGEEIYALRDEINSNSRYGLDFISSIDLDRIDNLDFQKEILERIYSEGVSVVVVDSKNDKVEPILPHLYNLIFSGIKFIDMHNLYEDIFDRVPLSLLKYSWFIENISLKPRRIYDSVSRLIDIIVAFIAGLISLIFYPFIILAIKFDDGGKIFSIQERVGRNNLPIKLLKFRTMTNANDGGKWGEKNTTGNKVTRIGSFLRRSRLDELPQLWNVLFGQISLIGPRPEFAEPIKLYEKELPYYRIRHLVKPGLSGWAQIYHTRHPHHGVDIKETAVKLSYDLYYIKNRSFLVDLKIILRTVKILLSRSGI